MNKQITEDYVSYETAKLLKEKGFDIPCRQAYFNGSLVDYTMYGFCDGELLDCPSQSIVLKWLREMHKIFVEPFVAIDLNGKYHYSFRLLNSICKDILEPKDLINDFKDTYEQAVEAACLYVLKNLI